MCSELGVTGEKILEIPNYKTSSHFDVRERTALEYADHITRTDLDVDESLFARIQQHFTADEIVELTATIAWENCSSKFNRTLRINSQQLWKCK